MVCVCACMCVCVCAHMRAWFGGSMNVQAGTGGSSPECAGANHFKWQQFQEDTRKT